MAFSRPRKSDPPKGIELLRTLEAQAGNVNEIAWSPDGRFLAAGSPDGLICLFEVKTGELVHRLDRGDKLVWSLAFSPDSRWLASGAHEGTINLWSVEKGELHKSLTRHESWVRSLAFAPDGRTLASGSNDQKIILWDLETGERRRTLAGHDERILSLRFSPDGKSLASAGGDGLLLIWPVEAGEEPLIRCPSGGGWQRSIAFSPDGRLIATGGEDRSIRLWRAADGTLAARLEGHRESIGCVSWNADGKLLASRSVDGRIRLWTEQDQFWQALARFKEPSSFPMLNMVFHPIEPTLATVARSHVRLWRLELESLRLQAEQPPTRELRSAKVVIFGKGSREFVSRTHLAEVGHSEPPIYELDVREVSENGTSRRREFLLWDLGTWADDPLLALHLRDTQAAVILLDSDPEAARQARRLSECLARVARSEGRKNLPALLLIASKPLGGRGAPSMPDFSGLALPLAAFQVLPADHPQPRERLVALLEESLDAQELEVVVGGLDDPLGELEAFLTEDAGKRRRHLSVDDLFRLISARGAGTGKEAERRARFELALRHFERRGLLRWLRIGSLVLDGHRVTSCARAFLRLAAQHGRRLGALAEDEAIERTLTSHETNTGDGDFDFLLRVAVMWELKTLGIAFKTPLAGRTHLVFPALFTGGAEAMPRLPSALASFDAGLDSLETFARLGLRLADFPAFPLAAVGRLALAFDSRLGGQLMLELVTTAGGTQLELSASNETSEEARRLFVDSAAANLEQSAGRMPKGANGASSA
jgi:WD40 repeat protein